MRVCALLATGSGHGYTKPNETQALLSETVAPKGSERWANIAGNEEAEAGWELQGGTRHLHVGSARTLRRGP